jgi:hypothetical protein
MKAVFIAAILVMAVFATQDDASATFKKLESSENGRRIMDTIQL